MTDILSMEAVSGLRSDFIPLRNCKPRSTEYRLFNRVTLFLVMSFHHKILDAVNLVMVTENVLDPKATSSSWIDFWNLQLFGRTRIPPMTGNKSKYHLLLLRLKRLLDRLPMPYFGSSLLQFRMVYCVTSRNAAISAVDRPSLNRAKQSL